MNFTRTLLPGYTPEKVGKHGPLRVIQDRILQSLLIIAVLLGSVGLNAIALNLIDQRSWLLLGFISVQYLAVFLVTLVRSFPYALRAGVFVGSLFAVAIEFLVLSGFGPETFVFCFAVVLYSGLFFGLELAAVILAIWLAVAVAGMTSPGPAWKLIAQSLAASSGSTGWLGSLAAFIVVAGSAIIAILLLGRALVNSSRTEKETRSALNREQASGDSRLSEGADHYQRMLDEARAAAEISRAISGILDRQILLQQVVELLKARFNLYYAGVFLLDADKKHAVLKAGTGEAGRLMVKSGHRLAVGGSSMIGWTTGQRAARIALDVGDEAVRFNNPHLPDTRSEIAMPVIARGEVLGALTIQSSESNAFDQDDITILQGIVDSLAIALENARLYQQAQDALEEVRTMNRNYLEKAWSEKTRRAGGLSFEYENTSPPSDGDMTPVQVPLMVRDQVIGQITLESSEANLSSDEMNLLEAIAAQTALALENARLLEESQQHAYEEQKLNEITEHFSQAASVDDILRMAVSELGQLPSATQVAIRLVPPESRSGNGHNGNGGVKKEDQ